MSNDVWKNKRVLITGATGFVGSWLVKELIKKGCFVVALVRDANYQTEFYRSNDYRRTTIINGVLEDFLTLERALVDYEIDTVFHLGAETIVGAAYRAPLNTFESNIRGSYNLLEACRRHDDLVKSIVVASSDKAYGVSTKLPYTEDMPPNGSHPYDVSKSCTDLLAKTYANTYDSPIAIARCGNIYGGGDLNWSRIVPGTIRSLYHNQRPVLRSDGNYVRDYIYVKDVVSAYLTLADAITDKGLCGEAFNFSTESQTIVLDIVHMLCKIMNREHVEPEILNRDLKEIRMQWLSAEKAHTQLGWQATYGLQQGLTETVAWYSNYFGECYR